MSEISNWFSGFLESATLHGTFQLVERPRRLWYKIIWLIIFFISLSVCVYCISMEIELYSSKPISTLITPMNDKDSFPDITICLKEPVNKAFIDTGLSLFDNYTFREINKKLSHHWIEVFENMRNQKGSFTNLDDLLFKQNFEREVDKARKRSIRSYAFKSNVLHSIKLDIVDCLIDRKGDCNSSLGKTYEHPKLWQCLTFSESMLPRPMLNKFSLVIYRLRQSSENFDPFPDPYQWTDAPTVCIHVTNSTAESSCVETNWNRIFLITFSSYVHKKSDSSNFCYDHKIYTVIRFPISLKPITVLQTITLCKRLEIQKQIVKKCGCYFEDLELPESVNSNIKGCHFMPWNLISQSQHFNKSSITLISNRLNCMWSIKENSVTNCFEYCEEKSFKISSTFSQSSMDAYLKLRYNFDADESNKQKERVRLFDQSSKAPASLSKYVMNSDGYELQSINIVRTSGSIEQRDSSDYEFLTFVSNIGSQMGLWLGCSIISLVEIFELIALLIWKTVIYHCQKSNIVRNYP